VRVEWAGATRVVAERAKRNKPDAARREGSRAMVAALVIAYDMAAAQAFRSGVSRYWWCCREGVGTGNAHGDGAMSMQPRAPV
jgi:hypothetical protein